MSWNISTQPCLFFIASGFAWQAAFKKNKVKSDLLTDINMLIMVEKGTRIRIFHATYRYSKANNKYVKDYEKNKEWSYLKYCDVNNLYIWTKSQKLLVNSFKWGEKTSQFNEDLLNSYDEDSYEGSFLKINVQYSEKLQNLHSYFPFSPERTKIEKTKKLAAN